MRHRMIAGITLCLLFAALFAECAKAPPQVVVVSKTLKKEKEVSTAVPDEFSTYAPASGGTNFWVEGTVKNEGTEAVSNVEITFKCTEGIDTRVLLASLKSINPGQTAKFRTKLFNSKYTVKLLDEEPEIRYQK